MNTVAQLCLNGETVTTPSQAAAIIIDLLASEYEIERETRDMLADALRRGLFGNREIATLSDGTPLPRLVLEGTERAGRVAQGVLARRKWFEVAEELDQIRANGLRGYEALAAAGEKFGLGIDGVKKAVKFRNKFEDALLSDTDPLKRDTAREMGVSYFDVEDEAHFHIAQSLFIERDVEATP